MGFYDVKTKTGYPPYITQRQYLQDCANKFGDFKVCTLKRNPDGTTTSTKWQSVLELWETKEGLTTLDHVNNRQIFPCEIVLDVEREDLLWLTKQGIDVSGLNNATFYSTGSKGYHVHILFSLLTMTNSKHRKTFREKILNKWFPYADAQKTSDNVLIALENSPHWKTGKKKMVISNEKLQRVD